MQHDVIAFRVTQIGQDVRHDRGVARLRVLGRFQAPVVPDV